MEETKMLLRKKLEKLNNIPADELDADELCEFKDVYETLYYLMSVEKAHKEAK